MNRGGRRGRGGKIHQLSQWLSRPAIHRCSGDPLLDAAGEFILPFGGDEGVFAGHLQVTVASDLRSFDSAAADLLPPRNIRASE